MTKRPSQKLPSPVGRGAGGEGARELRTRGSALRCKTPSPCPLPKGEGTAVRSSEAGSKASIVQANWYDYPQYYDLAFRSETRLEATFIEAAFRKYCSFPVRSLLEPACGTGRLLTHMAARGYRLTGLDLSGPSLDFLRQRLTRRRLHARVFQDDMADFELRGLVDGAYCTLDGFRHLLTEDASRRHLECVANSLRPGGIYILGFHLLPPDASEECTERWTERHGRTKVTVTLRVTATNRRRRIEQIRISLLARDGRKEVRVRDDFPLRMYTARQFRSLLASVPSLELCDVYDFWYEIDHPLKLDNEMSDTVFILKKRGNRSRGLSRFSRQ